MHLFLKFLNSYCEIMEDNTGFITPNLKKSSPKSAEIWKHFQKNVQLLQAKCNFCNTTMSYKAPKMLKYHLKTQHGLDLDMKPQNDNKVIYI